MLTRRVMLGGLGMVGLVRPAFAEAAGDLAGTWTGTLAAGSTNLRLRLRIEADGTVQLFSLDQGGAAIPARLVSAAADKIEIDVAAVGGGFRGRRDGADRLDGVWRQGAATPLVFQRGEAGLQSTAATPLTQAQLEQLRRECGAPALIAAMQQRGGTARSWIDGERMLGTGVAATRDDQWHIGSCTKSMTATLVARLVESGAINWDDTVGGMLAAVAPEMRADYKPATFRHLLSHRSGLSANLPLPEFVKFSRTLDDAREERRRYVQQALAAAPHGPMTSTFEYSNSGYIVAGAMLEAKFGQPWEALLAKHVFEPLKLASAGFGAPGRPGLPPVQPVGHAAGADGVLRAFPPGEGLTDNPVVLGPAGRVHIGLGDLLTYLDAHRERSSYLSMQGWDTLHKPPFGGDYALGWVVRSDGTIWHNGSNTLWYCEMQFDRARGVVAAAVANDGRQTMPSTVGRTLRAAAAAVS